NGEVLGRPNDEELQLGAQLALGGGQVLGGQKTEVLNIPIAVRVTGAAAGRIGPTILPDGRKSWFWGVRYTQVTVGDGAGGFVGVYQSERLFPLVSTGEIGNMDLKAGRFFLL